MTIALGSALLLLLFVDVLGTVFHPTGHGGPVHRLQNRVLWWLLKGPADAVGGARMVSFCGPLIVAATIVSWSLWLIAAFALLYLPWAGSFFHAIPGASPTWFDALYFSGTVVSTLGIGDLVPTTPILRFLTTIEALSGFALFAVATTYVLALTQRVGTEQVLALEVSTRLSSFPEQGSDWMVDEELRRWSATVAARLVEVVQAHAQYPALHYFRPADPRRSLLVQIRPLIELALAGRLVGPGLDSLSASLRLYLAELVRGCVPSRGSADDDEPSPASEALLTRERYRRLLQHLGHDSRRRGTS